MSAADESRGLVIPFVTNDKLSPEKQVAKLCRRVDKVLVQHGLNPQLKNTPPKERRSRLLELYDNVYVARELRAPLP